jgi:hypothetical protein
VNNETLSVVAMCVRIQIVPPLQSTAETHDRIIRHPAIKNGNSQPGHPVPKGVKIVRFSRA